MNFRSPNILSIGINRQRIGIAVFANGKLDYVTGKAVPAATSVSGRKQLVAGLEDLVRRHQIGIFAMPNLTAQQLGSRAVVRINQRIHTWAIRSGSILYVQNRRSRLNPEGLASIYPELRRYLGASAWARRYYKHIFKAVAVGAAQLPARELESAAHG